MNDRCILALGFFDGVHMGHQALLKTCVELAKLHSVKPGAVTFGSHPDGVVLGNAPGLINTLADRERLLRNAGMESILILPFDRKTRQQPWQEFIEMLMKESNAVGFVCGQDFRFGNRGEGNAEKLQQYCAAKGISCAVVPEQQVDGRTVSSTHIRHLIETGGMDLAVRFLGHPHILTGKVVPGLQLGRTLGIPTANLMLPKELVVPGFGVYACVAVVGDARYAAVTNIGTRPTVAGIGITVEPWILDFQGDLYGEEITLEFYRFLRPERRFPSLDAMREEIFRNAAEAKEILKPLI